MQRRNFSRAMAAMAAFGYGSPDQVLATAPRRKASVARMGTNLSGMEWARPGLRYGLSSAPNIHFTVPRKMDVAYLAACGFTQNRLPIQWELLQPMLHDTHANAATRALIGEPGHFHDDYASFITGVLDAHASFGMRCIIDLHNYGRYQDFKYQADGSVTGLTASKNPLLRPYTTDNTQVHVRIFSLAPGATLRLENFVNFWQRAASKWKGHPGLGGYGLMNEPHELPEPGGVVSNRQGREDLMLLPVFMQAAIDAIRTIDAKTPIYVAGNEWGNAASVATKNPGYPLKGNGLVYEVHAYLDKRSSGHAFDWETETSLNHASGLRAQPISTATGKKRIQIALDWAQKNQVRIALGEIGMPIDDPRWAETFRKAIDPMLQSGFEVYSWMGGNHWPIHNYALNHVPNWHQNRTLEPLVSGVMKASAGIDQATLFDDGPGYAVAGQSLTITLYARGNLASPAALTVSVRGRCTLSTTRPVIPAGPNGQVMFTCTPADNQAVVLSYTRDGVPGGQAPPPRRLYSLTDPVAYADTSLADAALAIMAKYSACHWSMADGHTDYMLGTPAGNGQVVRAVSDSGYGSSPGNAMEMINWINTESPAMGTMSLPVMRLSHGRKHTDHSAFETYGFWCKKSVPEAGVQPNPKNRTPYNIEDAHFTIAVLTVPALNNTGLVFQASKAEANHTSELGLSNSQPQARWVDASGKTVQLIGTEKLPLNKVSVLTLASKPGAQVLRVNSIVADSSSATFSASNCNQMLMGWGYCSYYPQGGFMGSLYAVITGKGAPSAEELGVLEKYLRRS